MTTFNSSALVDSPGFRIGLLTLVNIGIGVLVFVSSLYWPSTAASQLTMSDEAILGQQVWQQEHCISCHSIYGLGGHLGPDLTQIIHRKGEAFTRAYILAGGYKMPRKLIAEPELSHLMSYLRFIDNSGTYPIKTFPLNAYGDFNHD